MKNWLKYFLLAFLAWIIVDFTTTAAIGNPSSYYSTYMPALLIFYLGYPLIFSLLIYKFKLKPKKLFISMIIGIILVEIIFSGNTLFFSFPLLLLIIPISLAYYSMVTFVPLWITEKKLKQNKKWFIVILIIYIIGSLLNLLTQLNPSG